jgi:hypothetical protein
VANVNSQQPPQNNNIKPIQITRDYLEKNKDTAVYTSGDYDALIGKFLSTTEGMNDEASRTYSVNQYNFEKMSGVKTLSEIKIASAENVKLYNLMQNPEIEYDTLYPKQVFLNNTHINNEDKVKNKTVELYYKGELKVSGKVNKYDNKIFQITVNNKTFYMVDTKTPSTEIFNKTFIMKNSPTKTPFTETNNFDSLKFVQLGMQVPQEYIDSNFKNLKKMESSWGIFTQKMQFYSDIDLTNKIKLDDSHKRYRAAIQEYLDGKPIYVNKNEWKKYLNSIQEKKKES